MESAIHLVLYTILKKNYDKKVGKFTKTLAWAIGVNGQCGTSCATTVNYYPAPLLFYLINVIQ